MRFTVRMPDAPAPAASDRRGEIPTAVLEVRSEEILTGEAVALDVQPVGFFLRALGCLIDVLIAIVLFVLFLLASSWLVGANVLDGAVVPILTIVVAGADHGRAAHHGRDRDPRTQPRPPGRRQPHRPDRRRCGGVPPCVHPRPGRRDRDLVHARRDRRRRRRLHPSGAAPRRPARRHVRRAHADPRAPRPARASCPRCSPTGPPSRTSPGFRTGSRGGSRSSPAARRSSSRPHASGSRHPSPPRPRATSHPCRRCEPEAFLYGVVAIRRDRELRALELETQRVAALTAHADGVPRGFPRG